MRSGHAEGRIDARVPIHYQQQSEYLELSDLFLRHLLRPRSCGDLKDSALDLVLRAIDLREVPSHRRLPKAILIATLRSFAEFHFCLA